MLGFLKGRRDPKPNRNEFFKNAYSRGYARGRYDAAQTTGTRRSCTFLAVNRLKAKRPNSGP